MKISALAALLFTSMATAKADYWTANFYNKGDCSGKDPFQIGDEGPYGCQKSPQRGPWHSVQAGPNVGDWAIYFYESDDCTGGQGEHHSPDNKCIAEGISGTGSYSSFKVSLGFDLNHIVYQVT